MNENESKTENNFISVTEKWPTESRMVTTTKGDMNTDDLERKHGSFENDNEYTLWIEYWLDDELVHRSAHVHLKKNVVATGIAAMMGS